MSVKMITLMHASHLMRAISAKPCLELHHICQNYQREKRSDITKSWSVRYRTRGAAVLLEVEVNTLIPKD